MYDPKLLRSRKRYVIILVKRFNYVVVMKGEPCTLLHRVRLDPKLQFGVFSFFLSKTRNYLFSSSFPTFVLFLLRTQHKPFTDDLSVLKNSWTWLLPVCHTLRNEKGKSVLHQLSTKIYSKVHTVSTSGSFRKS